MKKQVKTTAPIQVSLRNHERLQLLKTLLGKKKIDDVIGEMIEKTITVNDQSDIKTIQIRQ